MDGDDWLDFHKVVEFIDEKEDFNAWMWSVYFWKGYKFHLRKGYDLKNIIFVFIGNGWGSFVNKLEENDLSFEWHRTSSNVHSEYLYQQNKLESLDSYFYLGFDGGAMGTYDAYFRGIKLMVAEGSYHDDIPDGENRIKNYNDFKNSLNNIIKAHQNKI